MMSTTVVPFARGAKMADDRAAKRVALVREILVGAGTATLDIAGVTVLDGAWSVVRAALKPVTDRLAKRLGVGDVTASKEVADRAAREFEHDQLLQDIFRSELVRATDEVIQQGADIQGYVAVLCDLVADNTRRLDELAGDVHALRQQIESGVTLNAEGRAQIREEFEAVLRPLQATEIFAGAQLQSAHAQALRTETLAEIADKAESLQTEAMRLLTRGEPEAALAALEPARLLLAAALREAPTSFRLKVLLGYVFKSEAQATPDPEARSRYLGQAAEVFTLVVEDAPREPALANEFAGAVNGLGNVYAEQGDYDRAIAQYRIALEVAPSYAYAWHDLFLALDAKASAGEVDLVELRNAYDNLERYAGPYPNLEPAYLEQLRRLLERWE
jgi:tetratricopeptide (TPR) repeat protein